MKNFTLLLFSFLLTIVTISCKKAGCTDPNANNYDEDAKKDNGTCTYDPNASTHPCGEGVEFCMDVDGVTKSGDATLKIFNASEYQINWYSQDSTEECSLFIIDGTASGDYAITSSGGQGTYATFNYHKSSGFVQGDTGLVTIAQFDTINGFTGNFNVELSDGSSITNGHFVEVKK